jgi:hypothetical protein
MEFASSNVPWWNARISGNDPHVYITERVKHIRDMQQSRRTSIRRCQQMYGVDLSAYGMAPDNTIDRRFSVNHLKNAIDTLQAKVSRHRILPFAVTSGGDYMQRKRAEKLSRFIEGAFEDTGFFDKLPQVVLDTLVAGTGCIKTVSTYGRLALEVVPMLDLYVDDAEARYGQPRSLHQQFLMDRSVVMDLYGDGDMDLHGSRAMRQAAIQTCATPYAEDDGAFLIQSRADMIYVTESWHLPSSPGAKDGLHVISIDNATLFVEPWKRETFPFSFLRRNTPVAGFWGSSAVFEFAPAQAEHNNLSRKIQEAHHIMGGSHILIQAGTLGKQAELDNGIGTVIEYLPGGAPPQVFNPDPVNQQTYAYRSSIPGEINQGLGLSDMSVHSELPAGLRAASGKALQVFEDFESERLHVFHKLNEKFAMDVALRMIDEAEAMLAADIDVSVSRPTRRTLEEVAWSEVRMDAREYRLRVYPISNLAKQPSAKFEQILSMAQYQLIDKATLRKLLEVPDIDAEEDLQNAPRDAVDQQLYEIIENRKYASPSKYIDPALSLDRAKLFYAKCLVDKVSEKKLGLLEQFMDECAALIAEMTQPQVAAPPPGQSPGEQPGGMAQGAPEMAGGGAAPPPPATTEVPQ